MSDSPEANIPHDKAGTKSKPSSPRQSPSLDATESELKVSRKREREISVEPVSTPPPTNDSDSVPRTRKDSRSPSKKNRRYLDSTAEEDDAGGSRSGSGSPPIDVLVSPGQEMKRKVRQISRGVEDITWRSLGESSPFEKDNDIVIEPLPPVKDSQLRRDNGPNQASPDVLDKTHNDDKKIEVDAQETQLETAFELRVNHNSQQVNTTANRVNDDNSKINVDTDSTKPEPGTNSDIIEDEKHPQPVTPDDTSLSQSVPNVRTLDSSMLIDPSSPARVRSGSDGNEKGLKRKYLERGTSQGPPDSEAAQKIQEPLKRPRDEPDKDDNPRETKRLTPPPSPPRASAASPKQASLAPKLSGFLSYASTSSPFASVKGHNVFASSKSKAGTPPTSNTSTLTTSITAPESKGVFRNSSSSVTDTLSGIKRSGFEAFASTSSPFPTAARSVMPVIGSSSKLGRESPLPKSSSITSNPFASYVGHNQGFALPIPKRARAGSPYGSSRSSLERTTKSDNNVFGEAGKASDSGDENEERDADNTTFGEKLRAARDDEDEAWDEDSKVQLTEQDVVTGEEEEDTVHQVRGKLWSLNGQTWKERGTGLLKLNVKTTDGHGARLVMRKDAVYTLLLNVTLFHGMRCTQAQDPRYIRFSAIEAGVTTTYNLKVSNPKIAAELVEEINAYIPT